MHALEQSGTIAPRRPVLKGPLAQAFVYPPFSFLDARSGEWQRRKRLWLGLGIQSELGRGANVLGHSEHTGNLNFYKLKRELEKELRRQVSTPEAVRILTERGAISDMDNVVREGGLESDAGRDGNLLGFSKSATDYRKDRRAYATRAEKAATPGGGGGPNSKYLKTGGKKPTGKAFNLGTGANAENGWEQEDNQGSGTSIFDPVLCELLYSWFTPDAGQVIDPFAGGSVRGIVAGGLGRCYWGCDLSEAQIQANRSQVGILPGGSPTPTWHVGDAAELVQTAPDADFVIACPPYFDLEVYSEDQRDLSTMDWESFKSMYFQIISDCVDRLREDRFAAFVIGDVRGEDGNLRALCDYTTACFRQAGCTLYNAMVLVTMVGSLPVRVRRQFLLSRKTGNSHQEVLVFLKGDPVRALDAVTGMTAQERREAAKGLGNAEAEAVNPPDLFPSEEEQEK
jgi:hypothetical protein